ncbi:hypothetical protein CERSUDRAFT_96232 [Gelatoporia subvermispora B]|uniref:Cytochrome P450 n=1 Tax=Ceriporiopsis subvermispora (strain B) TaxID=914234 RepID=M2QG43_CERS8|nr:hypothetical protein CERSUDRAFT_96232 [Gelatoporia subvermispora B]
MKPIVGNLLDINMNKAWLKFTHYKQKYGDLVYYKGLGKSILVVNDLQTMTDLFDKRASKRANCVFIEMDFLNRLAQEFSFCDYNEEWRVQRKLAHTALSQTAVRAYYTMQEDIAALLARDLVHAPENFIRLLRLTTGKIILALIYGIPMNTPEDKYITHIEELALIGVKAALPGAYLVDFLPILKYAPSWIPFMREAKYAAELLEFSKSRPYEHSAGTAPPSFVQHLLTDPPGEIEDFERRVKWAAGSMYGAGAETRQAQAEIDSIVGTDRLPTIEDKSSLPYVGALIKETMRWHPVVPLGVPHRSSEDDEYKVYFIPKSTVVIPNVCISDALSRAVALEPNEKYDPHSFLPERFLDPSEPTIDPALWAFGFSRRICPGRFLAENSIFIIIATLLATFDISPPESGEPDIKFSSHLISYPEPFDCRITPRSVVEVDMIKTRASNGTI